MKLLFSLFEIMFESVLDIGVAKETADGRKRGFCRGQETHIYSLSDLVDSGSYAFVAEGLTGTVTELGISDCCPSMKQWA